MKDWFDLHVEVDGNRQDLIMLRKQLNELIIKSHLKYVDKIYLSETAVAEMNMVWPHKQGQWATAFTNVKTREIFISNLYDFSLLHEVGHCVLVVLDKPSMEMLGTGYLLSVMNGIGFPSNNSLRDRTEFFCEWYKFKCLGRKITNPIVDALMQDIWYHDKC